MSFQLYRKGTGVLVKGRRESWDTVRGFERPANSDGFVGAGSRQGETSTGARRRKSRPGVRRGVLVQEYGGAILV